MALGNNVDAALILSADCDLVDATETLGLKVTGRTDDCICVALEPSLLGSANGGVEAAGRGAEIAVGDQNAICVTLARAIIVRRADAR